MAEREKPGAAQATADYKNQEEDVRQNTANLREQRLAREKSQRERVNPERTEKLVAASRKRKGRRKRSAS